MAEDLTPHDIEFILASLDYTRQNFESTNYPTIGLKKLRFDELDQVVAKVQAIRDRLADGA